MRRKIKFGKLQNWHRALAAWDLQQVARPTKAELADKASSLARFPISVHDIRLLEARTDYKEMHQRLQEDATAHARALVESHYVDYATTHREALDWASDKKDYKAIPALTNPILDRIVPKREDHGPQAPLITINIGVSGAGAQATVDAGLDSEPPEIVVVEPEFVDESE